MKRHLSTIFRALRYRNFRLFFFGQSVSLIGTWMQQVALSWLVYRLTQSPFYLGIVAFSSQIPSFIIAPFAGVLADRLPRLRILIVTQSLALLQALVLALLTWAGWIDIGVIIALSLLLGCVNAFEIPTRQSFFVELIGEKAHLSNAISLNSLMFNSARLIGPALAGVLLTFTSEASCFFINALSFLAVLVSLLLMRVPGKDRPARHSPVIQHLLEGLAYAFNFSPIRTILLVLGALNLFGASYVVLLPPFAKEVLVGDSRTFGFLVASTGIGAAAATVFLAARRSVLGLSRSIALHSAVFACGLIALSFTTSIVLALFLLVVSAFSLMTAFASCNIILQTVVDDDKRGRVMSFYTMAFVGTMPLGNLIIGVFAEKTGLQAGLIAAGGGCLLTSAAFALSLPAFRAALRPVYIRLGILEHKELPPGHPPVR